MSCNHGCQVSHSKKVHVHEPAIKCICKSVPFEVTVTGPTGVQTIFENPQNLPNSGLYTVVNLTNTPMLIDFIAPGGPFSETIPAGGSVTKQLNNLERIDVSGDTVVGEEDGRLDFEICFPVDFLDA